MGPSASKEQAVVAQEAPGDENVESSGMHFIEVHAPSSGLGAGAIVLIVLIVLFAWISYRRWCKPARGHKRHFSRYQRASQDDLEAPRPPPTPRPTAVVAPQCGCQMVPNAGQMPLSLLNPPFVHPQWPGFQGYRSPMGLTPDMIEDLARMYNSHNSHSRRPDTWSDRRGLGALSPSAPTRPRYVDDAVNDIFFEMKPTSTQTSTPPTIRRSTGPSRTAGQTRRPVSPLSGPVSPRFAPVRDVEKEEEAAIDDRRRRFHDAEDDV